MASNVLIAYPDIPYSAVERLEVNATFDPMWPSGNCICGERYQHVKRTGTGDNYPSLRFDTGVGNTKAVDYLIVARADLLTTDVTTLTLRSSTTGTGGSFTDRWTTTTLTKTGSKSTDLLYTGLGLSAYRTWEFAWDKAGAGKNTGGFSKLYFGTAFDMGRSPDYKVRRITEKPDTYYTGSGASVVAQLSTNIRMVNLSWSGITDAKVKEFENTIARKSLVEGHRFFLYTIAQHQILDNAMLLHCKLNSFKITKTGGVNDYNNIDTEWVEILG